MNKQTTMQYETIPAVPEDFEGAAAVHKEAIDAINYWKEQKKVTWYSHQKAEAQRMIESWFVVKNKAHDVIHSYQLRLF